MSRSFMLGALMALTFHLAGPASADPNVQAVILPLETTGTFAPVDDDKLTQTLQARLLQLSPANVKIQVARTADLTAYRYLAGTDQPPSTAMADTISRAYGTNSVVWVSIHFHPTYEQASKTLAVAGAARVWIYNTEKHTMFLDQTLSVVRTGVVKDIKHPESSQALANELVNGCLNDIAVQLVTIAQNKDHPQTSPAADWKQPSEPAFKPSAHYNQMVRAAADYQKAVDSQNFIDMNTGQQNLANLWLQLNKQEQEHLKESYPGIVQLLTQPVNNYWGGGYWPYYYGNYNNFNGVYYRR